jgi:hypothetical protein
MEQRDGKSPKPERDTAVKADSCTSMLVLAGVVDLSEAGGGKCWRGLREKMTTFVSD